ncbi:response regulator transcription factor [Actinoplanes sp. NPDC049599]|uniref:response regulator transcription factor n=1 Tax=Actinoplanes sp. NPDC049599 TaxID=3363903 RepID=UPI0037A973E6
MGAVFPDGDHVLVVVPDPDLLELLVTPLRMAGYQVCTAATGGAALALLRSRPVDLVIADVAIPDVNELARGSRLAPADRPPVLCLTSCEHLDRLLPELGLGIEDYVTKPCRITEVLARAQVLLRERRPGRRDGVRCHGDLILDNQVCRAWRDRRSLDLTAAEYRLLRHLLVNAGQVFSKEQLARQLWGEHRGGNAIERLVSRLRQKVDRGEPPLIHTRRGFGYVLGRVPERHPQRM